MARPDAVQTAVAARDRVALRRALAGARRPPGARAVVEAARLGWRAGLEVLARHGADLNATYRHYRPLHALIQERPHDADQAATPDRVACLEWLLAHGADPELTGAWPSARAVIVAAWTGERAYVRTMAGRSRAPDVFVAAALGQAARVATLVGGHPALATARDRGTLTALHCAAGSRLGHHDARIRRGLVDAARALLDAGAEIGATARSWGHDIGAGYLAVRSRQRGMLDLLFDRGLDPTSALATAAWDRQFDLVDHLLARGASLDHAGDPGHPVLNELVRWGQFAIARELLARGASPNVPDAGGWTALHYAASRGNAGIVRDLLAAGGDRSLRDAVGATPADVARVKRQLALARTLAHA